MKVLVLGGNGFIGSHVVDHLIAAGHKVRVFDRSPELFREPLKEVEYRIASFNDSLQIAESLRDVDAVCHLISTTVPSTSNLDPITDIETNLVGTLHLLEQMKKIELRRILFLSSGGTVYGNSESSPIGEDHPLNPISSYGVVKVAIEKYLAMYQYQYEFQPIVLRPSNPFGPRQGKVGLQGLIGTLLNKILKDEQIEIWGDGSIVRDYIHISDLARLCVTSLISGRCGVFNAGSGKGSSINMVVDMIRDISGVELKLMYRQRRTFDVEEVVLDISRATEEFGWSPEIPLVDGIIGQWEWLKSLPENKHQ